MIGGVDRDGVELPWFFLSYAHAHWEDPSDQRDADYWVRRFYGDLCDRISGLIDIPPGQDPVFIDRRLKVGARWPDELVRHLAECAVFVPLYTPKYFRRPDCGREWHVIQLRQDMHISMMGRCPEIVIPVLWEPIDVNELPACAQGIQFTHESLGTAYNTMGLESLLRLREYQSDYSAVLQQIAERIVEVAQRSEQLRSLHDLPRFQFLHDAFEGGRRSTELAIVRITVAALNKHAPLPAGRSDIWYGDAAGEWCPYRDGPTRDDGRETPVAWRAADVAQRRDFETYISELSGRSEELRGAGALPSAPTIVLLDAWTTLDERWKALLRKLDTAAQRKPWIRILIPWNRTDPETAEHGILLRAGIEQVLGRSLSSGRVPSRRGEPGPVNSAAFGLAVSDAIRTVQSEFIKSAQKHPPEGAATKKPRLIGPPGMPPIPALEETDGR